MEKLELRHLAGYLPYGLKIQLLKREVFTIRICVGSTDKGLLRIGDDGHHRWEESFDKIKPILRPLSDLTKEIEVNGVKFIPADIVNRDFYWDYVRNNMLSLLKDESYILVGYLPVLVVDKLLQWHFDIYGLIEKGLAIDINKI